VRKIIPLTIVIALISFFAGYFLNQGKERIVYTDKLELICKIYNETETISMACNPIDVERQKSGELVTFAFVLPSNISFDPSREIHCYYNLTEKRFTYCYQLNIGVSEVE